MRKILPIVCASILTTIITGSIVFAANTDTTIHNPLGEDTMEIEDLLLRIMDFITQVGGVVVVLFIIYSGFLFVKEGSSGKGLDHAKEVFWSTIIGGAILLGADVIAHVVVGTINSTVGR